MLPSPAELHYFLEVASTQNISRASERLGISQPTLSLAIQRLEKSIGVPLLIRGKSGVRLTAAGQKLALQAKSLVTEWERLRDEAQRNESHLGGRYTLGCHSSVAMYTLPGFLPALLREHPSLEIHLSHDLSRRITEDVISFKLDFGIVVNPTAHPDLVIRQLCKDEVGFWVGKPSSRAGEALLDPLSGGAVLVYDPDLLQSQSLLKSAAKKGMRFSRTLASSNLEVIASLVASGAGVGILPERVATRVRAYGLKLALEDAPRFSDSVCLVYRADAQRSKPARTIAERILKDFGAA